MSARPASAKVDARNVDLDGWYSADSRRTWVANIVERLAMEALTEMDEGGTSGGFGVAITEDKSERRSNRT
jgi:hypothetical protein